MSIQQMFLGAGGGGGIAVDEVFSVDLTNGTDSVQSVNNGIDLSGEGGMVWSKSRGSNSSHAIHDKTRGANKFVSADSSSTEVDVSAITAYHTLSAFNNNGFTLGADQGWGVINISNTDPKYVHWTFRKAPKFFDIVTWTGNSTGGLNNRNISHNLDCDPGMIIVKNLNDSNTSNWMVWHHSVCTTMEEALVLNEDDELIEQGDVRADMYWEKDSNHTPDMNSSTFSLGNSTKTNGTSSYNYVGYLFAKDEDNIKCGYYDSNSTSGHAINVGFEPQWLLVKAASAAGGWVVLDSERGLTNMLSADSNGAEAPVSSNNIVFTSTGFTLNTAGWINGADGYGQSVKYIYVAIKKED